MLDEENISYFHDEDEMGCRIWDPGSVTRDESWSPDWSSEVSLVIEQFGFYINNSGWVDMSYCMMGDMPFLALPLVDGEVSRVGEHPLIHSPLHAAVTPLHYRTGAYGNSITTYFGHGDDDWVELIQYGVIELGMMIMLVGVNFSHNGVHCMTPGLERQLWNPNDDSGFPMELVSASHVGHIVWDAFCFPFSPPTKDFLFRLLHRCGMSDWLGTLLCLQEEALSGSLGSLPLQYSFQFGLQIRGTIL